MSKSENSLMYESYLNQAGNAINQQADYGKDKYRPGLGKSNINQFSGLMGRGKPNAAGISNWTGGPSDEEIEDDELIEVRGFGVVKISQLSVFSGFTWIMLDTHNFHNYKIPKLININ